MMAENNEMERGHGGDIKLYALTRKGATLSGRGRKKIVVAADCEQCARELAHAHKDAFSESAMDPNVVSCRCVGEKANVPMSCVLVAFTTVSDSRE